MKLKIALLFLAVAVVALAVTLFVTRQKAETQRQQDLSQIEYNSNQWLQAQAKLDEEKQVAVSLNRELDVQKKAYVDLSNVVTQTTAKLSATAATLEQTSADRKSVV